MRQAGFLFERGTFWRIEAGVVQQVMFDLNSAKDNFKIMLGANALFLLGDRKPRDAGALALAHVRGDCVSPEWRYWPARTTEHADRSLAITLPVFQSAGLAWLNERATLTGLAASLGDDWVAYKAMILEQAQDYVGAAIAQAKFVQKVEAMPPSPEAVRALTEYREKLAELQRRAAG